MYAIIGYEYYDGYEDKMYVYGNDEDEIRTNTLIEVDKLGENIKDWWTWEVREDIFN